MKTQILSSLVAAGCLFVAGYGAAHAQASDTASALDRALAGEHRSAANRARDRWRHPKETLEFFGLRPDMTVVELYPGSGWYTEVIAPVVRERGKLVAAQFDPANPPAYRDRVFADYMKMIESNPTVYDRVQVIKISDTGDVSLGEDGSADLVVAFRNLHTWIGAGDLERMFDGVARVLKPGGVFGVVQHRAPEGSDAAETAGNGYVPEAFVIEKAREAGLELDARSDINANPADRADGPVWRLPPSLRGDDATRADREAIGESDRMTLRFVKR